ncbi:BZ3500_MvSof-1268-A1-R1_Chr3-1g06081 [Microbotryum saponariae]|uniref:BZ3500_MvSof-1268-A1-R1_Chr3-1g06081 protein n=1 Tax=Microbotryum saponariae TaxID=289078 RepID=A0A2X0MY73_9BASI|nr:BZ3500_MvSof-1268-A1-R1_Chr3-1g06081 [Microbotryum saponariae]SDA03928.1 BZ3501_MvSof-1269-A2-R1_Chr3-2g05766 [Microbotryum saponariae]
MTPSPKPQPKPKAPTSSIASTSSCSSSTSNASTSIPHIIQATLNQCQTISTLVTAQLEPSESTYSNAKGTSTPTHTTPSFTLLKAIRSDHLVLAQQIHSAVTSIALGFKPPISTGNGFESVFEQLRGVVAKVEFGVGELGKFGRDAGRRRRGGGCLERELRLSTQDLIEVTQAFLNTSLQVYNTPTATPSKAQTPSTQESKLRDQLLLHTSLVWAAVERSKLISENELRALNTRWKGVVEVLEDCLEEVKGLESAQVGQDGEAEDGEQDEDDYRTSHPLDEQEKKTAKACLMLLRIGNLVVKRVIGVTGLAAGKEAEEEKEEGKGFHSDAFQDKADEQIEAISEAADEVASCLEPPHDKEELGEAVGGFVGHVEALIESVLEACWEGEGDAEDKELLWFNMGKVQLRGAEKKVREMLVM